MPIGSFISQPIANSLLVAYRPVVLRVQATNTDLTSIPPVVYCDIYFNDLFYKTLAKTQYTKLNSGNTEWQFDIQDAAQEFLTKFLGSYAATNIVEAAGLVLKAQCKFRSSGFNVDGFITHEDTAPLQGTDDTAPISGTGTTSNAFYIFNAVLQQTDNQDASAHLSSFKKRTWSSNALPLTHRSDNYVIGLKSSDTFPFLYTGTLGFKTLRLNYRYCGQSTFHQASLNVSSTPSCNAVISTPIAVKNSSGWLVTWSLIAGSPAKYFISSPSVASGAQQETLVTQYQYGELSVGDHEITVQPLCFISGDYYFGEAKTFILTVPPCVNVGISGSVSMPNAVEGVAYSYSISLTGTMPFALNTIVKPAWMTIAVTGSTVNFSGTPSIGSAATGVDVSFNVTNCSAGTVSIADTIDVTEPITGSGAIQIATSAAGCRIDEVLPIFYIVDMDALPVEDGESVSGTHSGYAGAITVRVTVVAHCNLRLFKNGTLLQTIVATASATIVFGSFTFLATDDITITLSPI